MRLIKLYLFYLQFPYSVHVCSFVYLCRLALHLFLSIIFTSYRINITQFIRQKEAMDDQSDDVSEFLKHLNDLKLKNDAAKSDKSNNLEQEIQKAKQSRLARRLARSAPTSPNRPDCQARSVPTTDIQSKPASPTPVLSGNLDSPFAKRISKFEALEQSVANIRSTHIKLSPDANILALSPKHTDKASTSTRPAKPALEKPSLMPHTQIDTKEDAIAQQKQQNESISLKEQNLVRLNAVKQGIIESEIVKQKITNSDSVRLDTNKTDTINTIQSDRIQTDNIKQNRRNALDTLTGSTLPLKPEIDEKYAAMAEREDERLSRFLKSPSNRNSSILHPSPSMRLSASPTMYRSPSLSPERSPDRSRRYSVSPVRQGRYSAMGSYSTTDENLRLSFMSNSSTEDGYSSSRSNSPTRSPSPSKLAYLQSAMHKLDGGASPQSKRLSMAGLRPAPSVLQRSPRQNDIGKFTVETKSQSGQIHDDLVEKPVEEEDEQDNDDSYEQEQEQEEPTVQPSTPPTPTRRSILLRSPDHSPSPIRLRPAPSLHRTSSSLSMVRPATDRFNARELDLTSKYDAAKATTVLSQYGDSNFKPSPTHRSFLNSDDDINTNLISRSPDANKENHGAEKNEKGNSISPIRLLSPSSPPLSRTTSLVRSPSRSPTGKRWTPNKSSWLENVLIKGPEPQNGLRKSAKTVSS
ncbi:hypothetical protein V1512DRAFT_289898 [Lipomyces arxii]|uniref:uncharacterized protein n=1 Tax=Lipomyces arxii TaxID=56418 RepID=UPI0034CF1881